MHPHAMPDNSPQYITAPDGMQLRVERQKSYINYQRELNRLTKILHVPADIPNTLGFEFIGINTSGQEFPCVVVKNSIGLYSVNDAQGNPCFMQLLAWRKK